jgi:hypothetical protein
VIPIAPALHLLTQQVFRYMFGGSCGVEQVGEYAQHVRGCLTVRHLSDGLGHVAQGRDQFVAAMIQGPPIRHAASDWRRAGGVGMAPKTNPARSPDRLPCSPCDWCKAQVEQPWPIQRCLRRVFLGGLRRRRATILYGSGELPGWLAVQLPRLPGVSGVKPCGGHAGGIPGDTPSVPPAVHPDGLSRE